MENVMVAKLSTPKSIPTYLDVLLGALSSAS